VYADLAKGKRNWQVMAFALAGVLAIVTLGYVRLAASSRLIPYVVQVDRLGQVAGVGGMADAFLTPDDRLVASQLAQFVRAVRTVLPASAAAAQAEMLRRGYAFAAPDAAAFLNAYFAKPQNDPRLVGLRLARQVEVTSVLRVPDGATHGPARASSTWKLRWTETDTPLQAGEPGRTAAWEGYVTTRIVPPTTLDGIEDNPLGLSLTSIAWTRIADEPTTRTDNPAAGEAAP
jgi:type IV secretion system protein VirB5